MKVKSLDHISINVSDIKKSKEFYSKLLTFVGFKLLHEAEDHAGWGQSTCGVWIGQVEDKYKKAGYHRKRIGVDHVCFEVEKKEEVDELYQNFLIPNKVSVLYGGPKYYPEYKEGDGYYAVYFEDPDRLKLEFKYMKRF